MKKRYVDRRNIRNDIPMSVYLCEPDFLTQHTNSKKKKSLFLSSCDFLSLSKQHTHTQTQFTNSTTTSNSDLVHLSLSHTL